MTRERRWCQFARWPRHWTSVDVAPATAITLGFVVGLLVAFAIVCAVAAVLTFWGP